MGIYNRYILPRVLHLACSAKPIAKQRNKIVPLATGCVLEVGIGSGLNLPFYNTDTVTRVLGVEPAPDMIRRAEVAALEVPFPVEFMPCQGESIPLDSGSVDTALLTYTLCTVQDPLAVLGEIRRILVDGGELLFCEHGLAPSDTVRRWQNRMNTMWPTVCGGCQLNRDIPALIRQAGFVIKQLDTAYLPSMPAIAGYTYWGVAQVPD
jgi:ubiquinone/menaquinone biosynthesis C-methylase UbiE